MASKCKVDGCEKQSQANRNGMCHRHWRLATGTQRVKPGIKTTKEDSPPGVVKRHSGLSSLLEGRGLIMDIEPSLAARMIDAGVSVDDVLLLVEMLLAGQLRRVA